MNDFEDVGIFDDEEDIEAHAKELVEKNLCRNKYLPLSPKYSEAIRAFYARGITIPLVGNESAVFLTKSGTHVATGYVRIVIGDYGAYIEFEPRHIKHAVIMQKFPGEPTRPVKYIWKIVKDAFQAKVYEQRGTVEYADYRIGMYYIGVDDLIKG